MSTLEIREQVPLAEYTTFRLGGPARFFASVTSVRELREALAYAEEHTLPCMVLGGGSNVLVMESGWSGLVIQIAIRGREYDEDSEGDARVVVGAGESWDDFVRETVDHHGLWGLENLSLIPGTVGATPVQNVGAYGVEVKDRIEWVEALDTKTGELTILENSACRFGYRDSFFKQQEGKHHIVTRVAYRLSTRPRPVLDYKDLQARFGSHTDVSVKEVRETVCAIRAGKFPSLDEVGTAGSFFKNPIIPKEQFVAIREWAPQIPSYEVDEEHVKVPLAWILDTLGYKGKRVGAFGCHSAQPLVLVHYGGGTPSELILFARDIMHDVKEKFDITIEPEVRIVSNEK